MKYFDLFAGIGGFHLALRKYSHKCVGACEINSYARQIYSKNFNDTPIEIDATQVNWNDIPAFDILCAGFPCQAFSIAGKRMGFEDTRGTIFFEIARCLAIKRPKIFILENVKGILNHDKQKTIKTIFRTLRELGYNLEWQVINTKDYLPQNRERIFIVGYLRETSFQQIFPLYKVNGKLEEVQGKKSLKGSQYTRAIDSTYWKGGGRHGSIIKIGHINKDQQGMRVYSPDGVSSTISAQGGGWGAKTGLYMMSHKKANMKQRYQNRDTTWTLDTTGNKMAIDDKSNIRRLTPLECERLQGFPDGWTDGLSDTQRYKCLGNAVSVPVVEDIVSRLS